MSEINGVKVQVINGLAGQMVVLPAEFSLPGDELFISKNEQGQLVLTATNNKWVEFSRLPLPEVPFERDLGSNKPDLFEDWQE